MYMQAVLNGQLSADYLTLKEIHKLHHHLADSAIDQAMFEAGQRSDIRVFGLEWDIRQPH